MHEPAQCFFQNYLNLPEEERIDHFFVVCTGWEELLSPAAPRCALKQSPGSTAATDSSLGETTSLVVLLLWARHSQAVTSLGNGGPLTWTVWR